MLLLIFGMGMIAGMGVMVLMVLNMSTSKTDRIFENKEHKDSVEEQIRKLAVHYSKKSQWLKTKEEVEELQDELDYASNPFGYEDSVFFTSNMWSEIADVIIMCAQLTMQHGKETAVKNLIQYKIARQFQRIDDEAKELVEKGA